MSSSSEATLSPEVVARFEQLLAIGEYDLATTWGREIIRKSTNVNYDIRPSCIVVETKNFRGTHDYALEEGKLVVAEQGDFQYQGEHNTFRFTVYTLNSVVKEEIYANEVVRGEGFGQVEDVNSDRDSTWYSHVLTTVKSPISSIRRYVLGQE